MFMVRGCEIDFVLDVSFADGVYHAECYTWEAEGKVKWSEAHGESEAEAVGKAIIGTGDYMQKKEREVYLRFLGSEESKDYPIEFWLTSEAYSRLENHL
jgi:hypothetical protein